MQAHLLSCSSNSATRALRAETESSLEVACGSQDLVAEVAKYACDLVRDGESSRLDGAFKSILEVVEGILNVMLVLA
jgi:hypothetical protein